MHPRNALFNLRNLEVFRAVMRLGTITAAADALGSSQPTVTREISRLESQIGYALFERKRRRLHPTARAKRLYQQVQVTFAGLDDIDHFAERLRESDGEVLTVATLPAFAINLLPGILARLHQLTPGLSIDIQTVDPRDVSPVRGYDFDIGLIEGDFSNPSVVTTLVAKLPLVAVLPSGHALLPKAAVGPTDLAGRRLLHLGPHDPSRLQLQRELVEAGVAPHVLISCQSATALCEMVACGLGMAIVNPLTALLFRERGLHIRPFVPVIDFRVSVICPTDRPKLDASDTMIALLKKSCAQCLLDLAVCSVPASAGTGS